MAASRASEAGEEKMKLGKVEIEKRRSGSTKAAEEKMKLGKVENWETVIRIKS
jgi:hypothetical protein